MFENIKFHEIDIDSNDTNSNFSNLPNTEIVENTKSMFYSALNCDFNFSGKLKFLPNFPISKFAQKDLMYIQFFAILECEKNYYTERKNYNSYLLLYTYEGHGKLKYNGKSYLLEKGYGFFIDCRLPHHYESVGNIWIHSDLHFHGHNSHYFYKMFSKQQLITFYCPLKIDYQLHIEQLLMHYTTPSSLRELYISNALENLLLFLLKNCTNKFFLSDIPKPYHELIKYMENNFQKPLSLNQLSIMSGISKYHLSREFKKYTGFSPINYLIELRINHAKMLLTSTTIPSYKIGQLVGIPNENNFILLFKKHTNVSPTTYRSYFLKST